MSDPRRTANEMFLQGIIAAKDRKINELNVEIAQLKLQLAARDFALDPNAVYARALDDAGLWLVQQYDAIYDATTIYGLQTFLSLAAEAIRTGDIAKPLQVPPITESSSIPIAAHSTPPKTQLDTTSTITNEELSNRLASHEATQIIDVPPPKSEAASTERLALPPSKLEQLEKAVEDIERATFEQQLPSNAGPVIKAAIEGPKRTEAEIDAISRNMFSTLKSEMSDIFKDKP